MMKLKLTGLVIFASLTVTVTAQSRRPLAPADILRTANVGDAQISPNGQWVVYTVSTVDGDNAISTLWLVRLGTTPLSSTFRPSPAPLLPAGWSASNPRWSPDSSSIAFVATRDGVTGIWLSGLQRREPRFLVTVHSTNFFITYAGETLSWSPDSKRIAYISATEETVPDADSKPNDPRVIDRIQYKSRTSFSDNKRTHVFVVNIDRPEPRQLTSGEFYDHAIDFSPQGNEILFLSNHEPDPDAMNNSDIFGVDLSGQVRQITQTKGCEYQPSWSPDGKWIAYTATKRDVTTIDSVAEDTHVWIIGAEGGGGRELTGTLDRRARSPHWSPTGHQIYFLAGDEGQTKIYSIGTGGGTSHPLFDIESTYSPKPEPGTVPVLPFQVSSLSLSTNSATTLSFTLSDSLHPAELWITTTSQRAPVVRITKYNDPFSSSYPFVMPEEFWFKSFDGTSMQGWLIKPAGWRSDRKYPLILSVHGGPHGMFGWGFNTTFQVYSARGYAVLYLNPRGSSGYGQKFSDGTLNEWGGGDYKDLMAGVDEALKRYSWIDSERLGVTGGSYGGFMTNWIITQTPRFKAAVAVASLSNLISFYSTSLYQDLIHAEFGGFPWDDYDRLWQWSPLRYVRQVQTPTLFIHGEQDNDVHITQAEEMYTALKRRGVEAVFVRYPREGHGLTEPKHRVDALERTLGWFDKFLK
jgi:dipeptidyl aminopeptidase/acylaminoacyl peptidase